MNTNANIEITTDGAGEAAAGLNEVAGGFDKIGKGHDALKDKFQEKFQHVGLQLFAGEALRANGVGMETRGVINILNTGLTALFGAGTAAASGVLLVVTALAAVAGIMAKVIEHHEKMAEAADKEIKANEALIKTYEKSAETVKTYADNVQQMPEYIQRWAEAEKELNDITLEHQNALMLENVATINMKIVKEQDAMASTKAYAASTQDFIDKATKYNSVISNEAADLAKTRLDALNKSLQTQGEELAKDQAQLMKTEADITALHNGYANAADAAEKLSTQAKEAGDAASKAAQESADAETKRFQSWAEQHTKQMEAYAHEIDYESEQETKRYQHWAELQEKKKTLSHEMRDIEKNGYNEIVTAQSQAFAQMVVEGTSFADATAHMWKNLATQVIAQIEAMIAKYLVLMALTGGTGSFGAGSVLGKVFGMAEGGSVLVNQPTMFLAGEAGQPEVATFTPLSKMGGAAIGSPQYLGSGDGGSSISIGSIVTNVHGVDDPKTLAAQIGDAIVTRIRSRGDLNFVRT